MSMKVIEKIIPCVREISSLAIGFLRIFARGANLSSSRSAQKSSENPDTAKHQPDKVIKRILLKLSPAATAAAAVIVIILYVSEISS